MRSEEDVCKLEKLVINIIMKIRKDRNRACYQNIWTFLNRGGNKLEMDDLKELLGNMIEKEMIVNKRKGDNDSFFVNDSNDTNEEEGNTITSNTVDEDIINLIDDSFHDILINKIKSEVKIAVNTELSLLKITNTLQPFNVREHVQDNKNINKVLLTSLNSEIAFLRKELESKDTIIKMLLDDRNSNKLCNKKENETSVLMPNCTMGNKVESEKESNRISVGSMDDDNFQKSSTEKKANVILLYLVTL